MELPLAYQRRFRDVLSPVANNLEQLLKSYCSTCGHVDRIVARAKSPERFLQKASKIAEDGYPKYADPLEQIQDQIGARIVVFYLSDVDTVSATIERYLHRREATVVEPEVDEEFRYFGKHYILELPRDAVPDTLPFDAGPEVFELQIKTLFQHAWSEANHDLGYKPAMPLTAEQRRLLAYSSAQAWGADRVFDQLFREVNSGGGDALKKT